jgi:hypothetical protein
LPPPSKTPLLPPHERIDDATIPDDLIVWRELDPLEAPLDPQTNQPKVMSSVFRTEELSVRMSDKISQADVLSNAPGCYLAEFTVGTARKHGCRVRRDPNDPAHGLIYDDLKPGERPIPQKHCRRIRDASKLIVP